MIAITYLVYTNILRMSVISNNDLLCLLKWNAIFSDISWLFAVLLCLLSFSIEIWRTFHLNVNIYCKSCPMLINMHYRYNIWPKNWISVTFQFVAGLEKISKMIVLSEFKTNKQTPVKLLMKNLRLIFR